MLYNKIFNISITDVKLENLNDYLIENNLNFDSLLFNFSLKSSLYKLFKLQYKYINNKELILKNSILSFLEKEYKYELINKFSEAVESFDKSFGFIFINPETDFDVGRNWQEQQNHHNKTGD